MCNFIKRFFDFIMAFVALVFALPVIIISALVIALHFRENPFFLQERVGKDLKLFIIYKLRTMSTKVDAEGNLLPDSERLTKVGKWLRKSSFDELPQLVNVLKGDMSIVGPRPFGMRYVNQMSDEQKKRLNVLPGITGWAQINGRNNLTHTKKFALDVWYINNKNFALDFRILLLTFLKVLRRNDINQDVKDKNFKSHT